MPTTTKKMLATVNLGECGTRKYEFLIPRLDGDDTDAFLGIDSGKSAEFGAVSYTGVDLVAETLFSRYIDSGGMVPDVDRALRLLDDYLRQIKTFKIGNVLGIRRIDNGFELFLAHNRPPAGII